MKIFGILPHHSTRNEWTSTLHRVLLVTFLGIFIWSGINPADLFTWFLEIVPAILGLIVVLLTYKRFRMTNLVYVLIWIHAIILVIGGHYTYAEMPLFNWIRDTFDLSRNYYDRVGHFAQGFIPAMVAREVLLRTTPLQRGRMLFFLVVCVCLAISSSYELFEWVGSGSHRNGRRCISWIAGGHLGHAMGHVSCTLWVNPLSSFSLGKAR